MEACVGRAHTCLSSGQSDVYYLQEGSVNSAQQSRRVGCHQDLAAKARCWESFLHQRKRRPGRKLSFAAPKCGLHCKDVFKSPSRRKSHMPGAITPSQRKKGVRTVEHRELKEAVSFAELQSDAAGHRDNPCSCPEDFEWDGGWFGGHALPDDREEDELCNVPCIQSSRWHQLNSSSGKLLPKDEVLEIVDIGDTSSLSPKRHAFGLSSSHDDALLSPSRWRKGDPSRGGHLDELGLPLNVRVAEGGFSSDMSANIDPSPPLNWPYERPGGDELSDLQVEVALAIPSWYYKISGKQQDLAYGHDLEEEEGGSQAEEMESLEAKPSPRSIILIPPYQRVALATELLIASFTGGGINSDDPTDHQVHSLNEEKKAAFALPSLSLEESVRVVDWEEWEEGAEVDAPGFFLAPDEEAMLSRLSSSMSADWHTDGSPSNGGEAAARPSRAWPVLFGAVVVGCLAGLMAMKSEAPVLAVDLLLITWSATVTAVAAACVGVLRRGGGDRSAVQTTAYEPPAKQFLWSRVVLVMGFIAGCLAASTCLALIVRATVAMLLYIWGGCASLFPKFLHASGLATLKNVNTVSSGSWGSLAEELAKAVPDVVWGCGWVLFLASMPILLVGLGLLLISGRPDSNQVVKP